MNILVINPPNSPYTNRSILAEPIDVLQVATIINDKFSNVSVIDMDLNMMENNIDEYLEDIGVVVFVYDYQLPLHTSESIDNVFEIIKNSSKNVKYICIGKTPSYYYKKFLKNGFDIIIDGIADNIINDVISAILKNKSLNHIPNIMYKDNDKIIVTKKEKLKNDFNYINYPKREFLSFNNYMDTRTMITSRGCMMRCNFCPTPSYFGTWSGKAAKKVVDEIEYLIKEYKATKIIFLDDNMTVSKERVYEICNEIKKRKIHCLFGCLSSISYYDKELFKEMYSVGFRWIHFGIESGSSRILKLMNKSMNIEYIKKVIKDVKDIGYRVRTSIILDYPTSTVLDITKTKELLSEITPHEIRLHFIAYRVNTKLFEQNKNLNVSQYIHNNHPNIENEKLNEGIDNLVDALKKLGYNLVFDEIDWNKFNNLEKNTKIASFVPIKYGMCWYE